MIAGLDAKQKVKVRYQNQEVQKMKYLPFQLGIMNVDKITELGWRPQVGLQEAFRFTLESFLQQTETK